MISVVTTATNRSHCETFSRQPPVLNQDQETCKIPGTETRVSLVFGIYSDEDNMSSDSFCNADIMVLS